MNSTELPGHNNKATVMPKVTYYVSELLHPVQTVEEEVVQRSETQVTPDDDTVCMTMVMFNNWLLRKDLNYKHSLFIDLL